MMRTSRLRRHWPHVLLTALTVCTVLACSASPTDANRATPTAASAAAPATAAPAATMAPRPQKGPVAPELLALAQEAAAASQSGTPQPFTSGDPLVTLNARGDAVAVTITARDIDALLPPLRARGFVVIAANPRLHKADGYIPIDQLPGLADLTGQGLLGVVPITAPQTSTGSVLSQGDFLQEADRVRASAGGYDGSGVRVGILSDSFARLTDVGKRYSDGVASGDLPNNVNVLLEGPDATDEGRAMAELVYDLAPGAGLAFATAYNGQSAFANAIRDLADPAKGNCQVIVDDIVYFEEPFFQEGEIAQAIDEVVSRSGATYFSAAGNYARQSYESTTFSTAAETLAGQPVIAYDFDPGAGVDTRQRLSVAANSSLRIAFQWDDPFYTAGDVDTDIDLYLVDASSGSVVAQAVDDNVANQIPSELLAFTNSSGSPRSLDLVISLFSGPAPTRIKYVSFGSSGAVTIGEWATSSSTVTPHAVTPSAMAVGAVNYFSQDGAASFSSAGPATILFSPTGARLAAPQVRAKPDIAAIQGTDTTFFGADYEGNGFPNFFGTSAAAPHAAAVAALIKQAYPSATPAQIYQRLIDSARDIGAAGVDDLTGAGLINAYDAIFGPAAPASLPYSDGFEAAGIGPAWETNTALAGRIELSGRGTAFSGSQHILLESVLGGFTGRSELVLHIDARHHRDVTLAFREREYDESDEEMPATFSGTSNSDGVAFSVDGVNWVRLASLTGATSSAAYAPFSYNLSAIAGSHSMSLGADVRIKFQQYGAFAYASGGIAIDQVAVTGTYTNQAPALSASALSMPAIVEDVADGANAGRLVSALLGANATDDDADPLGVAVLGASAASGIWQYSLDGGASWSAIGSPSPTAALLLPPAARLRFVPTANFNGSVDPGLSLRAWDQTSGTAGQSADASTSGGGSSFSGVAAAVTIEVKPVNDPPVVSLAPSGQALRAGEPFSYSLDMATFSDVDVGDSLSYSAALAGGPLPGWLSFDPATLTLSGTPGVGDAGQLTVRVTATDSGGLTASADVVLAVSSGELYLPLVGR